MNIFRKHIRMKYYIDSMPTKLCRINMQLVRQGPRCACAPSLIMDQTRLMHYSKGPVDPEFQYF